MNTLINIDDSGKTTARELYEFLGLNSAHYARWCKSNIDNNQFAEENVDFFPFTMNGERGAQATTNYYLSIDFAKKLCMVSNSPRGEQARNYFIEVEKRFKNNEASSNELTFDQRIKVMEIISKSSKYNLPHVLDVARPFLSNNFTFNDGRSDRSSFVSNEKATTDNNQFKNQSIFNFLNETNVLGTPTNEVYEEYLEFCRSHNFQPTNKIHLSRKIVEIMDVQIIDKTINGEKRRLFVSK